MTTPQTCLLRLVFQQSLYDEITDALLSFAPRQLEFIGLNVQGHMQPLQSISEKVSGFKQMNMIEVTTNQSEAEKIHQHIKQALPMAKFQSQLLPYINLDK